MQASALLAFNGLPGDEIAHIDHVSQFTDITTGLDAFEQSFGFFIEHIQTVPGTLKSQVASHNAHIIAHHLSHFLHALSDEHFFLVGHRALIIPFRNIFVEHIFADMLQTVFCCRIGIDHSLDERIAGQTVAAMQTGAGALSQGIEPVDARLSVEIDLDAATHIMGCGPHGDVVLGDIDAYGEALLIDVGEVVACFLGILVRHVKAHMVDAMYLHFLVDGSCHNVARSQRQSLVVFLHERLSVGQTKYAPIAAHGLCNQVGRMCFSRVIQCRGMKLHELHVLHRALGTIYHCFAIARGNHGVGGGVVNSTASAGTHQRHLAEIGVHLLCAGVQHIGTKTFDVGGAPCHLHTQMMLGDDFHGKVVFLDLNVRCVAHRLHQATLYLCTRVVGMVQNSELRVSTLTVQVKVAILLPVKVHSPLHQFGYLLRSVAHHLFHRSLVADIVARNHRVFDVLVKVIYFEVSNRCHTALGKRGVGLIERCLAYHAYFTLMCSCYLKGITHTGNA